MPLFFLHHIDTQTKLAIWKIEEGEAFFLRKVPLQRQITHPHKRLQHLAGRYLLSYLFPRFPVALIRIADTRKPFLAEEEYHFSLSHCGDFAAAIVSEKRRVGIDIELVSDKISRIQHKFVSPAEAEVVQLAGKTALSGQHRFTALWSCKEAVFKWYGAGDVDFKKDIVAEKTVQIAADVCHTEICFKKEGHQMLLLTTHHFGPLVLSFLVT